MQQCSPETFGSLVTDLAHWELELFIMLVFDGVILGLAWPWIRRHWRHHLHHDRIHDSSST